MKSASVRELSNHYTTVFQWIDAGEDVLITKRGKTIARLIPEKPQSSGTVDWSTSAALTADKSSWPILTAEQVQSVLDDSREPSLG